MKTIATFSFLAAAILLTPYSGFGQAPAVPVPGTPGQAPVPRQRRLPSGPGVARVDQEWLSRNYIVKLAFTQGEKTSELHLLTASSTLQFSGPMGGDGGDLPANIVFTGMLTETEDGKLGLQYSLAGRIPGQPVPTDNKQNVTWLDESSSGALHVTSGKPQVLLQSGGRSYTLTITPVE
jgi:hypothetical protein